jgi:hypothetical protein
MKKLLITLGCSYTEGMGCYDYSKFPKGKHIYSEGVTKSQIKYQINRFHEMGYPNRLGKKLGYDKVINLGLSGASTSGMIKKFVELFWNNSFDEFDEVLVFFWLPTSDRFSFYKNGKIINMISNKETIENEMDELSKSYLNFISDFPNDFVKEQIFYLKMMTSYCKSMGFNFLWFLDDTFFGESVIDKFPLDNWIGIRGKEISDQLYFDNSPYINEACFHPNEIGYEFYSKKFYDKINKDFNFLIGSNEEIINWEYV